MYSSLLTVPTTMLCLPSFMLVGGVAGGEGCTVGGAGLAVVDTSDTDDLTGSCVTVEVTKVVTIEDTQQIM